MNQIVKPSIYAVSVKRVDGSTIKIDNVVTVCNYERLVSIKTADGSAKVYNINTIDNIAIEHLM